MTKKRYGMSPYLYLYTENNKPNLYDLLKDNKIAFNSAMLSMMNFCIETKDYNDIIEKYDAAMVGNAIQNNVLIASDELLYMHNLRTLEIETVSYCNNKCEYCPVSFSDQHIEEVMSKELFIDIIDKAIRCKSIREVTFHFYGEPTLDPYFEHRIQTLSNTNIKLDLHTNATFLDKSKISLLKNSGVLNKVIVNYPSNDETEYNRITNSNNFSNVYKNIILLCESGLPVVLNINGEPEQRSVNKTNIDEWFGTYKSVKIEENIMTDRCGLLENKYSQNIRLKTLAGCEKLIRNAVISVNGDFIICCNDFRKKYVLGNIADGEIDEILKGNKYISIRNTLLGLIPSDDDLICHSCWEARINKHRRSQLISYIRSNNI